MSFTLASVSVPIVDEFPHVRPRKRVGARWIEQKQSALQIDPKSARHKGVMGISGKDWKGELAPRRTALSLACAVFRRDLWERVATRKASPYRAGVQVAPEVAKPVTAALARIALERGKRTELIGLDRDSRQ